MIPRTKEEWMQWFAAGVTIFVIVASGWLYARWHGNVTIPQSAPVVMASAATPAYAGVTRTDMGPLVSRDELLSSARYVVNDWREADEVMVSHSAAEIKAMLATNEIVVMMPPCKDGHPWIDQTKILIRYSCEGPMP